MTLTIIIYLGLIWLSQLDSASRSDFRVFAIDATGKLHHKILVSNQSSDAFFLAGFDADGWPVGITRVDSNRNEIIARVNLNGTLTQLFDNGNFDKSNRNRSYATSASINHTYGIVFKHHKLGYCHLNIAAKEPITTLINQKALADIPPSDLRNSVFQTSPNQVWFCTSNGLFRLTLGQQLFNRLLCADNFANAESIRGITSDNDGNIYVTGGSFGLIKIDKFGQRTLIHKRACVPIICDSAYLYFADEFRVYQYQLATKEKSMVAIENVGHIWTIFKDPFGVWWYGGNNGMIKTNDWNKPGINMSKQVFGETKCIIYQILYKDNKHWFVTSKGLFSYHQTSGKAERISLVSSDNQELLNSVHQVQIKKDIWWISTNGNGLIKWWPATGKHLQFTIKDGLPSNTLYASLTDSLGRQWISTNYGLVNMDVENSTYKVYTTKHGLGNEEFNRISWHKDNKGLFYFGSINGLVFFKPEEIDLNSASYTAPLAITKMVQYNSNSQKLENYTSQVVLSNHIKLTPASGYFSLICQLLDFEDDKKYYAYKFAEMQQDWTYMDGNNLQIGGLPYGEYTLQIKGQNEARTWSNNTLSIKVTVLKPYYLSFWFIFLVVSLLIALGLVVLWLRTWQLKTQGEKLRRTVRLQTDELQTALKEKELLLKEVHHRVKNNLQIISSLLNLERTAERHPETLKLLQEARFRIKSMALIHKNLYQFDDLSHIMLKPYIQDLIKGLDQSYRSPSRIIEHNIITSVEALDIEKAIPIGLIITELISNSYKYAFADRNTGCITININQKDEDILVLVGDDGIGFEVPNEQAKSKTLGLRLVDLLTNQLKGKLTVDRQKGCKFYFQFPLKSFKA